MVKLPLNCEVTYYPAFSSKEEAGLLLEELIEDYQIQDKNRTCLNGEDMVLSHSKLMFVDQELYDKKVFPSKIWGATAVWSDQLKVIKERVEALVGTIFQTCVCIYYPDGKTGVDFHSDLMAFGDTSIIPSMSIGEERTFVLRSKEDGQVHDILLENGSLIIMGENCQERYEHSLPIDPKYKNPRINLTFRKYGFDAK